MTHSRISISPHGETEETEIVNNLDFLRVLFSACADRAFPMVVSLGGNPASAPGSAWCGAVWQKGAETPPHGSNNYFSLAAFQPDDEGRIRRRKVQFASLHALMLDDVGGKVPFDRLTLPPTWLVETSPGNYQMGFKFREPLVNSGLADRLMKAIIAAGLCDPGADGPTARLARLPVGVNGKHQPPFVCKMAKWEPERTYSVEELVAGLQLDLSEGGRPVRAHGRLPRAAHVEGDPVWTPGPEENPVLAALQGRSLYKASLGEGRHDITCPWVEEHTGGRDQGTAYFEPGDHWPLGGFKCHHGHCAGRQIRDLLGVLGVKPRQARMRGTIRVVAGEMNRVADAAERELAKLRRHYQRSGLIVTVVTDPGTRETRIEGVSLAALTRALSCAATWERHDGRSQDWVRIDPPQRYAALLSDATDYRHLPVLNGIARQPYLRHDGSLMGTEGYDEVSGMYGVFDGLAFPIPVRPTRQDAEIAARMLEELLLEFPFALPGDRAAALSAVITAAVRPSLPTAPMFHVRAHMPGSGKSYLCSLVTAFATPQNGMPTTLPSDDEECRKLLLAELMKGPAVVEFDNLNRDLVAHKSLCTALTSEFIHGRLLGISKTVTVSTRALFLSSGNNVGPTQDMTRRCLTINLAPQCEIPAARDFHRPDLVGEVLKARGRCVAAALTIVRAWIEAGRPLTDCRPLAGYGEWSNTCRQPLLWLGFNDPVASVFEAISEDPDRVLLLRLMSAWNGVFGRTGAMVRDAIKHTHSPQPDTEELLDVLREIANERGEINARKLGWWIKRHAGRIVDGMRMISAGGNSSAERWRVEQVPSVSSVSSLPSARCTETAPHGIPGGVLGGDPEVCVA